MEVGDITDPIPKTRIRERHPVAPIRVLEIAGVCYFGLSATYSQLVAPLFSIAIGNGMSKQIFIWA